MSRVVLHRPSHDAGRVPSAPQPQPGVRDVPAPYRCLLVGFGHACGRCQAGGTHGKRGPNRNQALSLIVESVR